MTYEEAIKRRLEFLKIDIKHRLHKRNPAKYPKPPPMYSNTEALNVAWTLTIKHPNYKNPFERDDVFYRFMKK